MQFYADSSSGNPTPIPSQIQMQFYTDSSSGNPTPVPSIPDAVLHGLIIRKPYRGSLFPRWSFTQNRHQETLHRFLLFPRGSFTRTHHQETQHRFLLSKCNFIQTHRQAILHGFLLPHSEVLHGLILKQPYPGSFSQYPDAILHGLILRQPYPDSFSWISRCSFTRTLPEATLPRYWPPYVPRLFQ